MISVFILIPSSDHGFGTDSNVADAIMYDHRLVEARVAVGMYLYIIHCGMDMNFLSDPEAAPLWFQVANQKNQQQLAQIQQQLQRIERTTAIVSCLLLCIPDFSDQLFSFTTEVLWMAG